MLKEKLFKLLFPDKVAEINNLIDLEKKHKDQLTSAFNTVQEVRDELIRYSHREESEITENDLFKYCLETLGVPMIDFSNVDNDGKPPHYLASLTDSERKDFIAHLETIYSDPKFQTVVSYIINLIGNYSIQKAEDDKMRNGKLGIIGIRTFMGEFINAHTEYNDQKKPVEGFDPLAVMPE